MRILRKTWTLREQNAHVLDVKLFGTYVNKCALKS